MEECRQSPDTLLLAFNKRKAIVRFRTGRPPDDMTSLKHGCTSLKRGFIECPGVGETLPCVD